MKLPRFTIRELTLITLFISVSLGWWIDHFGSDWPKWKSMDRSWMTGKVVVEHSFDEDPGWHHWRIDGDWPDATPELYIRGTLFMVSSNAQDIGTTTVEKKLSEFTPRMGWGKTDVLLAKPRPLGFVFDYEIWDGEPGKGKLLTKQSVASIARETQNSPAAKPSP